MTKNNKYVVAAIVVGAILTVAGVAWFWHSRAANKVNNFQQSFNNQQDGSANAGQANQSPGSLNVNGTAGNLGQLSAPATNQQNGTGSTDASSPANPASFAQYDKYKDAQNALFGEIQQGTGTELTVGRKAAVIYKGWLTNGTMFDQSRTGSDGKLEPFVFALGDHQVIPGWEEGVNGMKVGGKRLLIVPPAVGYGANGQGPIPGNSVLIFEVQLVAVQ